MFERSFSSVGKTVEWRVYDLTAGRIPADPDECDGYITSGSGASVYEPLVWIERLEEFIRLLLRRKIPFVGICFGHQALARALGGQVDSAPQGWRIGVSDHHVVRSAPWMRPPLENFTIPVIHQDQVTSLPPGAVVLAENEQCPNFVITVHDRLLGVQGHPEFDPAYIAAMLELRKDRIPAATYDSAVTSLQRPHNNAELLSWIAEFLGVK